MERTNNIHSLFNEKRLKKAALWASLLVLAIGAWLCLAPSARAARLAQQPTVSIPTVTGTPSGPMVSPKTGPGAEEFANVRAGPGLGYARVGVLAVGQEAPALGRTTGGDWIMIMYIGAPDNVGWVYSPNVNVVPDVSLPIVVPPPPPTPAVPPTIDPTLAAPFIQEIPSTRLPTFPAPAPLTIPTYPASSWA